MQTQNFENVFCFLFSVSCLSISFISDFKYLFQNELHSVCHHKSLSAADTIYEQAIQKQFILKKLKLIFLTCIIRAVYEINYYTILKIKNDRPKFKSWQRISEYLG